MRVTARTVVVHIVAWGVAFLWLLPFISVAMASVRPFAEIAHGWWQFEEFNPTLDNFREAWGNPLYRVGDGIRNSFIVAIPATLIPMFVAALAGYGFARFRFPTRDYIFLSIVLLMAIPQMMIAIPIFRIMNSLGLVNTYLGLILLHSAWGLPWIILFMRNFFKTIPIEIEEAARVDGASDFKVFYRVVLPVALPAFASVAVLQFMWVWNDFFLALILMRTFDKFLATQRIPIMKGQFHFPVSLMSAGSILVMLVPVLLYVFLQRFYIRGMIGWTVKG